MLFEENYKSILCPAKINLHLRVGPKRTDSYHEIATLMARLEWGDLLDLKIRQSSQTKIQLSCSDESIPVTQNLVYRAAQIFSQSIPVYFEAEFILKKKTPSQAGLGGGSSDAAITLRLLSDWYTKRIGKLARADQRLAEMAAELGSDISFFLDDQKNAAWCTGRGERIEPLSVPSKPVILLFPPVGVSTKEAYQELDQWRKSKALKLSWGEAKRRPDWLRRAEEHSIWPLENDFQEPVITLKPEIGVALKALCRAGALMGGMSGSGSAVYGLFADEEDQGRAHFELTKGGWEPISTRIQSEPRQNK